MTDQEIIDNTCILKNRFNELFYELKGNFSDEIPNLSDLNDMYGDKLGRAWDNLKDYSIGDMAVLEGDIFISKTDSNIGLEPDIYNETNWKLVNVKNLALGRFYSSAHCFIRSNGNTLNGFENFELEDSWNIDSLQYLGSPSVQEGQFRLNFNPNAGIVNSDYQVISASRNKLHAGPVYNRFVFNTVNVIFKSSTFLIFKIPYDRDTVMASITIVPVQ